MKRPLIVGEAPSATSDPETPISGECGKRLARYASLSLSDFQAKFARMNLIMKYPGKDEGSKGTRWDAATAKRFADVVDSKDRLVILLGLRVAAAFGFKADYLEEKPYRGGLFVIVPHPSGINQWYNKWRNVAKVKKYLTAVAPHLSEDQIAMVNHASLAAHAKEKKAAPKKAAAAKSTKAPAAKKVKEPKPPKEPKKELKRAETEIGSTLVDVRPVSRRVVRFVFSDDSFFDVKPTGYPRAKVTAARDAVLAWFKKQIEVKS